MPPIRHRKKKQRQKLHKQYHIKHNHKRQNPQQRKPPLNNLHAQNPHKKVHSNTTTDIHVFVNTHSNALRGSNAACIREIIY